MMSVDDNRGVVTLAFEALTSGERGPVADLLAPGCVLHQCGVPHPIPAASFLERARTGEGRIAGREMRLERIVAEGDQVALHYRTAGTFRDSASPQRDGKPVDFPSMAFMRI